MTGRPSVRGGLLAPLWAGGAAWSAALVFHRAFGYEPLLLPLTVAALAPALTLPALVLRRRLPPVECTLPALLVLGPVVCALLLFSDSGTGSYPWSAVRAAAEAAPRGWIRLLGTGLPAAPTPELLCFPFLLTWLASLLGAEAALRLRARGLACLPSVILLVVGVMWCVPGDGSAVPEATAVTLCAGALLRVRSGGGWPRGGPGQGRQRSRGRVTGYVWTTAVVATAATITWTLPWPAQNTGYDLRDRVTAPVRTDTAVDPLAQLARWHRASGTPLFTVTGPATDRWRLCALTAFDGRRWAPEGTFVPTGGVVPAAGPAGRTHSAKTGAARGSVHHRVVLSGLDGAFLPVPAEPVRITGPAVAVSPRDATVLAVQRPGRGTAYTVDSVPVIRPAPVDMPGLRSAGAGSAARDLPPGVPGALTELAGTSTARADTPYARAAGIAKRLREEYTHVPDAPGVATYGGVARFLEERQGPAVVFGAAFTLAARLSGLPARLVVGFVPRAAEDAAHDGRAVTVAGRDAKVWGEVYFDGVGWLPFDPVPRPGRAHSVDVRPSATAQKPTPSPTSSSTAPRPSRTPEAAPATARATPRTAPLDPDDWLLPLCLSLAGLLFAARALRLVVLPVLRERGSRRAAAPADRVRGAWHAAVRRLADAGVPVPPSASVTDVGRLLAGAAGPDAGPAATGLAHAAQWALYGDPGPEAGRASCVTAEEADRAWDRCDRLARALRRRSGIAGPSCWLLLVPGPLLLAWRRARAASRENRAVRPTSQGAGERDTLRRARGSGDQGMSRGTHGSGDHDTSHGTHAPSDHDTPHGTHGSGDHDTSRTADPA
ncbi:DUF4129 domain-containing protein [Streptomyces sp. HUCO-GS316]|uniref:transglutaminase domain-containing protein n=1 Tax=Streptomyces sp. HUCO-GS316 TaxID=2692198 RepID=UPI001370F241|nr:transglutaminase domain-containing protein [Streptomyces sp. HUCO-GS316]MXM67429.1 DUF4129 domain-containing protein [Streptomyces sp. HUCO-GS316]